MEKETCISCKERHVKSNMEPCPDCGNGPLCPYCYVLDKCEDHKL